MTLKSEIDMILEEVQCPICNERLWCKKCNCTWGKDKFMIDYSNLMKELEEFIWCIEKKIKPHDCMSEEWDWNISAVDLLKFIREESGFGDRN